jgi:hypothetical protein
MQKSIAHVSLGELRQKIMWALIVFGKAISWLIGNLQYNAGR